MTDAILGRVVVGGAHDAPIPWPYRKRTGAHALIVCGALLEALHTEMAGAIADAWRVSLTTVWAWRKALGIDSFEVPAHKANKKETFREHISLEAQERGLAHARTPEAIARMAASKRGLKMSAEARAKISAYQRGRPKSPEHRAKLAAHCRRLNASRKIGTKLVPY